MTYGSYWLMNIWPSCFLFGLYHDVSHLDYPRLNRYITWGWCSSCRRRPGSFRGELRKLSSWRRSPVFSCIASVFATFQSWQSNTVVWYKMGFNYGYDTCFGTCFRRNWSQGGICNRFMARSTKRYATSHRGSRQPSEIRLLNNPMSKVYIRGIQRYSSNYELKDRCTEDKTKESLNCQRLLSLHLKSLKENYMEKFVSMSLETFCLPISNWMRSITWCTCDRYRQTTVVKWCTVTLPLINTFLCYLYAQLSTVSVSDTSLWG